MFAAMVFGLANTMVLLTPITRCMYEGWKFESFWGLGTAISTTPSLGAVAVAVEARVRVTVEVSVVVKVVVKVCEVTVVIVVSGVAGVISCPGLAVNKSAPSRIPTAKRATTARAATVTSLLGNSISLLDFRVFEEIKLCGSNNALKRSYFRHARVHCASADVVREG